MTLRIALSLVLIIGAGAYVGWHAIEMMALLTEAAGQPESLEDPDLPERLVENARRAVRIYPFLSGGGVLLVGVALAVHEAARLKRERESA